MLYQGMSESTQKDIVFKDIQFHTLSLLVEYLYTGIFSILSHSSPSHPLVDTLEINAQNVVDLFVAADRFQVTRLRSLCENYFFLSTFTNYIRVGEEEERYEKTPLFLLL